MSRKDRNRQRRAVERQVEEAWQALDEGAVELAARIARRAKEAGSMNPRVLHECGLLLRKCGLRDEAEETLRAAILRAPDYADAFGSLAELLAEAGRLVAAVRLQARAVELRGAGDEVGQRRLAELRELLRESGGDAERSDGDDAGAGAGVGVEAVRAQAVPVEQRVVEERLRPLDVEAAAEELVRTGTCVLGGLLSAEECAGVVRGYETGAGMEREYRFADGSGDAFYRWFLDPLPAVVAGLRAALWVVAAKLAEELGQRLGERWRFPAALAEWLEAAARRGRRRQAVRVVRLTAGAETGLVREEERRAFPLRVAVDLGAGSAGVVERGEAVGVVDRRPGKKVRRHAAATRPGDAVVFCARDRLDRVGGVFGLQPVEWTFGPFDGERFVLDLPFEGDG